MLGLDYSVIEYSTEESLPENENDTSLADFLSALWPEAIEPPHMFGVGTLYKAKWINIDESLYGKLRNHIPEQDAYFHVCAHDSSKVGKTGRGNKKSATVMPAIWADIDIAEKDSSKGYGSQKEILDYLLKSCPLRPSIIIDSGSGGFHVYWLLKEPELYNEEIVKGWQKFLSSSSGYVIDLVANPDRLLRVPDTWNTKASGKCRVVTANKDLRYDVGDFEEFMPPVPSNNTFAGYTEIFTGYTSRKKTYCKPRIVESYLKRESHFRDFDDFINRFDVCNLVVRRLLLRPTDKLKKAGDVQKIKCVVHKESRPSAALIRCDSGAIVYKDFHLPEPNSYSIYAVYAWLNYGKRVELSKPLLVTWTLRALVDACIVNPAKVPMKSNVECLSPGALSLYVGFLRLIGCRWLYEAEVPAPFSYGFAMDWCGIKSKATVSKSFKQLTKNKFICFKDEYKGTNLYFPVGDR